MAASATTTHLTADALAIIDLRCLTQSELLALSMCTASSNNTNFNNGVLKEDKDDLFSIPKIDRSAFNESAGSRKQTYSRLRLAPRSKSPPTKKIVNPNSKEERSEQGDWENRRIVKMLKEMIGEGSGEEEDVFEGLVDARIECDSEMEMMIKDVENARHEVRVEIGAVSPVRRKRGRPKKDSDLNVSKIMLYDSDMDDDAVDFNDIKGSGNIVVRNVEDDKEMVNRNGEVVDLDKLGNVDDPFGAELRRRTDGMGTKEELLEFLNELDGLWVSRRRKRKIVDASGFGDALPLGWKLLFSIKKRAGIAWLICRRYIRFFHFYCYVILLFHLLA